MAHTVEFAQLLDVDVDQLARAFLDEDHQDFVFYFQPYVLEKARGEQCSQRLLCLLLVHGLADFNGQIAEYRPGLGALQPLDADVLDHERAKRLGGRLGRCHKQDCGENRRDASAHDSTRKETV